MGGRLTSALKFGFQGLLELIYGGGDNCIHCGAYAEKYLCTSCLKHIVFCSEGWNIEKGTKIYRCYSAVYYTNIVKELISGLKYRGDFNCGRVLLELMEEVIAKQKLKFDAVAYVPMTLRRERLRGYNQSRYLAKVLAENHGVTLIEDVVKSRETVDQIGLDGVQRWLNLENSFTATREKHIAGKHILLVDDVITTGATSFYCALALEEKGADEIIILTAAKSSI